jgi:hypothetical protein
MALERGLPSFEDRKIISKERTLQQDIERFGNVLWRGPALEVVNPLIIKPGEISAVEFSLEARHLPFDGDVSLDTLLCLFPHMRSRYAHIGLDVMDVDKGIFEAVLNNGSPPTPDNPLSIELLVNNHCARAVELAPNARPFHLFYHSDSAHIRGDELENKVGNSKYHPVHIRGEEGEDWIIIRETSPTGKEESTGVYLKIDPSEKFWIPPSSIPISITEEGSFQEIRGYLFKNIFKKTDDPETPMPKEALWIGKGPFMRLAPDIYAMLDHEAYALINGTFEKVGLQTHSPLLEGGRTNHQPHFEIKGEAQWVRTTFIKNGNTAKPG